jgi:hypothetical protein
VQAFDRQMPKLSFSEPPQHMLLFKNFQHKNRAITTIQLIRSLSCPVEKNSPAVFHFRAAGLLEAMSGDPPIDPFHTPPTDLILMA